VGKSERKDHWKYIDFSESIILKLILKSIG
jgi:hypothetical protein